MAHHLRKVALARLEHEVVVVARQAVGQRLRVESLHEQGDDVQVGQTIDVVSVDWLPAVAECGDVVDGTWELDAEGWDIGGGRAGGEEGQDQAPDPDPSDSQTPDPPVTWRVSTGLATPTRYCLPLRPLGTGAIEATMMQQRQLH